MSAAINQNKKTDSRSMTSGSIIGAMVSFAIPLFFGNLFQQLYNSFDLLIVGKVLGNDALAGISSTASLIDFLISFFQGVFTGAGIVVARFFGAGDNKNMSRAVHTTLAIALVLGIVLTGIGVILTPAMLRLMDTPEEIFSISVSYIRTYFAGVLALVLYNACTGIMQAVGDSRHPLIYLIISSLTNIVLDLLFVCVFHFGVFGAGLATILSEFLSAVLCLLRLLRIKEEYRFIPKKICFDPVMIRLILNYGLPSGFQNSIICFANVIVQSNINTFGKMAVAGIGAYDKMGGFGFLPINSFIAAITTFVGQNLGAKNYDRTKQGAKFGILCSVILSEIIGFTMYILAVPLISAFTKEAEAIAFGVQKTHILTPFFFALSASHCLSAVLRGAGKAKIPMFVMLCIWCVFRVTFISVLVPLTHNINVVNWIYPITWSISTIILLFYFIRGNWLHSLDDQLI